MSELADDNHDMTRGVYRRQYAGFVGGARINRVSLEAEAWFWRVHAAADDYGNCAGEPSMLYAITVGRRARAVSIDRVVELVGELVAEGLLLEYESAGERYLNVAGFVDIQPGGRNGKRVHRVPASPWDGGGNGPADPRRADAAGTGGGTKDSERNGAGGTAARKRRGGGPVGSVEPPAKTVAGASRGIQTIPGVPGNSQQHHYHDHNHNQSSPAPAACGGEGEGEASGWTFPCEGTPATWVLPAARLAAVVADCPDIDVEAELCAARAHLAVKPRPAAEMPAYVLTWLARSQKRPELRARRPRGGGGETRAGPASSAPGETKTSRTQRAGERLTQEIHDEQQRLSIPSASRAAAPAAGDGRAVG